MIYQPTFLFHADLCTGCKACTIACKDKHNLSNGIQWRRVLEYSGGQWICLPDNTYTQNVFAYYISLSCNHCADPACTRVCPTGAMQKDEYGIVFIDKNLCIACGACKKHCPYDAPQLDSARKIMSKCDFCRDTLKLGHPPICVAACPCRALDFGSYNDMVATSGEKTPHMAVAPLPEPTTKPHFICIPPRHTKAQGSTEGIFGSKASNPEELPC